MRGLQAILSTIFTVKDSIRAYLKRRLIVPAFIKMLKFTLNKGFCVVTSVWIIAALPTVAQAFDDEFYFNFGNKEQPFQLGRVVEFNSLLTGNSSSLHILRAFGKHIEGEFSLSIGTPIRCDMPKNERETKKIDGYAGELKFSLTKKNNSGASTAENQKIQNCVVIAKVHFDFMPNMNFAHNINLQEKFQRAKDNHVNGIFYIKLSENQSSTENPFFAINTGGHIYEAWQRQEQAIRDSLAVGECSRVWNFTAYNRGACMRRNIFNVSAWKSIIGIGEVNGVTESLTNIFFAQPPKITSGQHIGLQHEFFLGNNSKTILIELDPAQLTFEVKTDAGNGIDYVISPILDGCYVTEVNNEKEEQRKKYPGQPVIPFVADDFANRIKSLWPWYWLQADPGFAINGMSFEDLSNRWRDVSFQFGLGMYRQFLDSKTAQAVRLKQTVLNQTVTKDKTLVLEGWHWIPSDQNPMGGDRRLIKAVIRPSLQQGKNWYWPTKREEWPNIKTVYLRE
jgi:hypothetical protein